MIVYRCNYCGRQIESHPKFCPEGVTTSDRRLVDQCPKWPGKHDDQYVDKTCGHCYEQIRKQEKYIKDRKDRYK